MTYSNLTGDRILAINSEIGYLAAQVDKLPKLAKRDRNKQVISIHKVLTSIEKELVSSHYTDNISRLHEKLLNLRLWLELTSMAI